MKFSALCASLVAMVSLALPAAAGEGGDHAAFERLKGLEGAWNASTPAGDGTITYKVASAGSIVDEHLFPGTDHEMMTVYHMDGENLVATHYCSAGNQPRFKLDSSSTTADRLHFAFNGGSNMKSGDGHIHEGTLRLVDDQHVEAEWAFWKGGALEHTTKFSMTRRQVD